MAYMTDEFIDKVRESMMREFYDQPGHSTENDKQVSRKDEISGQINSNTDEQISVQPSSSNCNQTKQESGAKPNTFLGHYKGTLITEQDYNSLVSSGSMSESRISKCMEIPRAGRTKMFIDVGDGENDGCFLHYLNHICEHKSNVRYKIVGMGELLKVEFYTSRPIAKDQELCWPYIQSRTNDCVWLQCFCQKKPENPCFLFCQCPIVKELKFAKENPEKYLKENRNESLPVTVDLKGKMEIVNLNTEEPKEFLLLDKENQNPMSFATDNAKSSGISNDSKQNEMPFQLFSSFEFTAEEADLDATILKPNGTKKIPTGFLRKDFWDIFENHEFVQINKNTSYKYKNETFTMANLGGLMDGTFIGEQLINTYLAMITDSKDLCYISTIEFDRFRLWENVAEFDWKMKEKEKCFVAISLYGQWALAVVNFQKTHIELYDSCGQAEQKASKEDFLRVLRGLLNGIAKQQREKCVFDKWQVIPCTMPEQTSLDDHGVFTLVAALYRARRKKFDFEQKHMKFFRRKILFDLLTKVDFNPPKENEIVSPSQREDKSNQSLKSRCCICFGLKPTKWQYLTLCCESCAEFFDYWVTQGRSRMVCNYDSNCTLIPDNSEKNCKACWFKKCIQEGMTHPKLHDRLRDYMLS